MSRVRSSLADLLVDPVTGGDLRMEAEQTDARGDVIEGRLLGKDGIAYPVRDGIPRLVGADGPESQVAASFGYKWSQRSSYQAPQFATRTLGVDGSVRYDRSLPLGSVQASYALRFDRRDQTASAAQTAIVGERVDLTGTSPVALAQARTTSGSVVVSNVARTQVFLEGADYVLTVVGTTTRIQRVLSGDILDGEAVLADYTFDAGGTYANTQWDQNLNLNWTVSRFLSVYFRYAKSTPRVTAGAPSSPLNAVNSTL